jgi:16S rRNA (cytosine967-C5)-methyltransferase
LAVSPSRRLAFQFLQQLEEGGVTLSELLFSDALEPLHSIDRNLVTELVYGVLRNRSLLDRLLQVCCHAPLSSLDQPVLQALRLGAYQILFLSRIPPRAAIYESVEIVKGRRLRSAGALVNAVLRHVSKEKLEDLLSRGATDSADSLAWRYSHPEWMVKRWLSRLNFSTALSILKLSNQPPPVFFRVNAPHLTAESAEELLRKEGVRVEWRNLRNGLGQVVSGELQSTELFRQGKLIIQDAGSQVIPFLLEPRAGEKILDLCSAPGGKTSEIAWLTQDQARIVALDINFLRLAMARKQQLTYWKQVHFVVADGTQPLPLNGLFDKILLDAPCSGTGTLRRNPDIRWKLTLEKLLEFQMRQIRLLTNAAQYLNSGGILLYSTCSLEEEENEQVIESFLVHHPEFVLILPQDPDWRVHFDDKKFFHLFPSEGNADGFFSALLKKAL